MSLTFYKFEYLTAFSLFDYTFDLFKSVPVNVYLTIALALSALHHAELGHLLIVPPARAPLEIIKC